MRASHNKFRELFAIHMRHTFVLFAVINGQIQSLNIFKNILAIMYRVPIEIVNVHIYSQDTLQMDDHHRYKQLAHPKFPTEHPQMFMYSIFSITTNRSLSNSFGAKNTKSNVFSNNHLQRTEIPKFSIRIISQQAKSDNRTTTTKTTIRSTRRGLSS